MNAISGIHPPAELQWLVDKIGEEGTLLLIEAHGGTRIYLPKHPTANTPIVKTLGMDLVVALTDFHSDRMKVPLARAWRARVYRARGESQAKIARRLGLTEGAVFRILQGAETGGRQMSFQGL